MLNGKLVRLFIDTTLAGKGQNLFYEFNFKYKKESSGTSFKGEHFIIGALIAH